MATLICSKCGYNFDEGDNFCLVCGSRIEETTDNQPANLHQLTSLVKDEIRKVIKGKDEVIDQVLMAVYASGNVLLEDGPGSGKTTLAKTLAKVIDLEYHRQQFTPDTMPSDIIGFSRFDSVQNRMVYEEGIVFCNLLLADEINRTSAKTQAALLEAMEEQTVTVDGNTRRLPDPFCVIATQNPNTSRGTQPLPDSQRDRFLVRLSMGYPDADSEVDILMNGRSVNAFEGVRCVMTKEDLSVICKAVDRIYVNEDVCRYLQSLVATTRQDPLIAAGVSTRGSKGLLRYARAHAFLNGRNYVTPVDVQECFLPVCNHRITLSTQARMEDLDEYDVLRRILKEIPAKSLVA